MKNNSSDQALDILLHQLSIPESTATDDIKMNRVIFMLKSSDRYKSIRTAIANETWSKTPSPVGISFMIPFTDQCVKSDPFAELDKLEMEPSIHHLSENLALKPKKLNSRRKVSFSDDVIYIERPEKAKRVKSYIGRIFYRAILKCRLK